MKNRVLPFSLDLEDLRRRLIVSAVAIAVGFVVTYYFKEPVLSVLMKPMVDALPPGGFSKLVYTGPHEAFMTYCKTSLMGGIALAMPLLVFQIWRFVGAGLGRHEKTYALCLVVFATLFFFGGALFAYFLVFPQAFKFFTSFSNNHLSPMISTKEYLSFSSQFLLAFGVIFELPIFVFFLSKIGLVNARFLRSQRRYAILLIFIVAAVLTPTPDAFTQALMAGPLLILYEISIWIAHFVGAGKARAQD